VRGVPLACVFTFLLLLFKTDIVGLLCLVQRECKWSTGQTNDRIASNSSLCGAGSFLVVGLRCSFLSDGGCAFLLRVVVRSTLFFSALDVLSLSLLSLRIVTQSVDHTRHSLFSFTVTVTRAPAWRPVFALSSTADMLQLPCAHHGYCARKTDASYFLPSGVYFPLLVLTDTSPARMKHRATGKPPILANPPDQ
jgi:hypothetical protein